jgi:hypothetical protein
MSKKMQAEQNWDVRMHQCVRTETAVKVPAKAGQVQYDARYSGTYILAQPDTKAPM